MINYVYLMLLSFPFLTLFLVILFVMRDDNRIQVSIINRNHEIRTKKVNPNIKSFKDRDSLYIIPSDCVTLSSTVKGLNPKSELTYVEDNPLPINYKAPKIIDSSGAEKELDANVWIVNTQMKEMVLENTAKASNPAFNVLLGYLSDPKKLLLLVFVFIVAGALLFPETVPKIKEVIPL